MIEKDKLHALINDAKQAQENFKKWIAEQAKVFPTLIHFFNFTKTNTKLLQELINQLSDKIDDETKKLTQELLSEYLFFLNNINLIFSNRLMNVTSTYLQPKLVELYMRQFESTKSKIERSLGIEGDRTKDYHLTINFE